jgi:hypothetical protein
MNSKKLITLLVLVTLIIGMFPVVNVSAALTATAYESDGDDLPDANADGFPEVDKGDKIAIIGGGVPSGELVSIYWDDSTIAWNGVKGKLNDTTGDSDGTFEVWFKVPEATKDFHYVWVKSGTLEPISVKMEVIPKVSLSASSGLATDRVDVSAYGLKGDKDVAVFFVDGTVMTAWSWNPLAANELLGTDDELDDTLAHFPLEPGSLVIEDAGAGVDPILDAGNGSLYYDDDVSGTVNTNDVKVGTINYVTGDYDIDYNEVGELVDPTGNVEATAYDYYLEVANQLYLFTSAGDTNAVGTYTKRIEIPNWAEASYWVAVMDSKGYYGTDDYKIGAVIELSKEEGDVGTVVRVTGRGFRYWLSPTPPVPPNEIGSITETIPNQLEGFGVAVPGVALYFEDDDEYWLARIIDYETPIAVDSDGEFRIDIFIPDPDEKEEYEIIVNDGYVYAKADFEVTGLPDIELSVGHGPQGSRVTVTGENFPNEKDTKVYFYVWDQDTNEYDRGTAWNDWDDDFSDDYVKIESDGSFEEELRVPTQPDGTYDLLAIYWDGSNAVNMDAKETFRIGTILVLLSDDEGASGLNVIMTGNGFTYGEKWNATFAGEELIDDTDVESEGLISDTFFVPQIAAGVYDIVVTDVDTMITVTIPFEVTATTEFVVTPSEAPTGYNMSFDAYNWPEAEGDWEFIFYNTTSAGLVDEDWDITDEVWSMIDETDEAFMDVNEDLEAHGFWILEQPNGDEFSKGEYLLNVSNGDDFFVQVPMVVGDVHMHISPRKATFRVGDTVSFNIEHSFGNVKESDEGEINGGKVKIYDPDGELYWVTDELLEWTDKQLYWIVTAAQQVAATNPMVLLDDAPLGTWTYKWYANDEGDNELLGEGSFNVAAAAADILGEQIEDLNTAIDDLTSDISAVTDAVAGVQSNVNSAIAAANAAVEAANAAVDAVNAVAATAGDAAAAAQDAASAAEDAKNAASGLTTLVYGAIGASLVAALAAIVSLMQISRRIAG